MDRRTWTIGAAATLRRVAARCMQPKGLPDTKIGTFTQALYDEAKKKNWTVISMKNDWKRSFPFD
jgi:hypothetical protein